MREKVQKDKGCFYESSYLFLNLNTLIIYLTKDVDKDATLTLKLSCASYSFVSYHQNGDKGTLVITDPSAVIGAVLKS